MYQQTNGICVVGHMQSVYGALRSKFLQVCFTHTHTYILSAGIVQSVERLSYGPDSPGIESRWGGEIFPTTTERTWGPPSLLYNGYRVFFEGKPAGAWR